LPFALHWAAIGEDSVEEFPFFRELANPFGKPFRGDIQRARPVSSTIAGRDR